MNSIAPRKLPGTRLVQVMLVACLCSAACGTELPTSNWIQELKLRPTWVEARVAIRWSDERPAVGVKVFNHHSNTLLGLSDAAGQLTLVVPNGTVLRMVDPAYGQQQALHLVQGKRKTQAQAQASETPAPDYDIAGVWWEIY